MDLLAYLNSRGVKKLVYKPGQNIPDPSTHGKNNTTAGLRMLREASFQ